MEQVSKNTIDLFDRLTDQEFLEVKDLFHHQKLDKGGYVFREWHKVSHIYFIASGLVRLFYTDDEAKECILSFAFENWWETDFSAFYHRVPAISSLQCIEDSEIFSLHYDDYRMLTERYPHLSGYFLDKSVKGHIANQKRILSLLTLSAKKRYEQFLQLYPSLIQRIPKSILSLYLGVSRETLSRLYKNRNT